MKFIFDMQINNEVFYNLILSFWVCVNRYAQRTQNNKFAISLQYSLQHLKENLKEKVDFPLADKRRSFFQIVTIVCKIFTYFKGVQSCWLLLVIVQDKHYGTVIVAWQLRHHSS